MNGPLTAGLQQNFSQFVILLPLKLPQSLASSDIGASPEIEPLRRTYQKMRLRQASVWLGGKNNARPYGAPFWYFTRAEVHSAPRALPKRGAEAKRNNRERACVNRPRLGRSEPERVDNGQQPPRPSQRESPR